VILYGRNPVREALRGRRSRSVGDIWAAESAVAHEPWLREAPVRMTSAREIERRCGSPAHQGVCAEAGPYPYTGVDELLQEPEPLIVALDEVQDPQNLGSICRTAECAGSAGIAIPQHRAAEITPAACKASAGAVEHLRIARVRNLADFLIMAREADCWCYGASAGGAAADAGSAPDEADTRGRARPASAGRQPALAVSYDAPDYRGSGVVLVLGSEGRGLRPRVAGACDQLIALPMLGRIESLGVSAAAAAILYEILQQRRSRS
jgi:23S rRNA (guanosine2251-2'-O)-methyltransferase